MITRIDTEVTEAVRNYEDRIRLDEKFKSFQLVLETSSTIFEAFSNSLTISDDDLYEEMYDKDSIITKEKILTYSNIKENIAKIKQKTLSINEMYKLLDSDGLSVWSAWFNIIQQVINNIDNLKKDCIDLSNLIEKWWVVSLRLPVDFFIYNLSGVIEFIEKRFPKSNEVLPIKFWA